jgi:hypothetical protein
MNSIAENMITNVLKGADISSVLKLKESFMEPEVYETDYIDMDTSNGGEIVPCDVVDYTPTGNEGNKIPDELKDYIENAGGELYSIERKHGWVGRMQAPGYMDSTSWTVGATEEEVIATLKEYYGDEEDDEEDDSGLEDTDLEAGEGYESIRRNNRKTEGVDLGGDNDLDSRAAVEAAYKIENGVITDPGQMENNAIYVPYFWDKGLNGFSDQDDGEAIGFSVTEEDIKEFPELKDREMVVLFQSEDGFVNEGDEDYDFEAGSDDEDDDYMSSDESPLDEPSDGGGETFEIDGKKMTAADIMKQLQGK